jgi:hypothetical protein
VSDFAQTIDRLVHFRTTKIAADALREIAASDKLRLMRRFNEPWVEAPKAMEYETCVTCVRRPASLPFFH